MPQRNSSRRLVLRLVLFTLAGWLLWALGKNSALPGAEPEIVTTAVEDGHKPTRAKASGFNKRGFSKRRLASTLAFTTLFFAGAAFTAGAAGDAVSCTLEGLTEPAATCAESAEATSADDAGEDQSDDQSSQVGGDDESSQVGGDDESSQVGGDDESSPVGGDDESSPVGGDDESSPVGGDDESSPVGGDDESSPVGGDDESGQSVGDEAGQTGDDDADSPAAGGDKAEESDEPDAGPGSPAHAGDEPQSNSDVGVTSEDDSAPDLEFDNETGYGVVWLHRELGDPTPPAKRLAPAFARQLVGASRASHVDWALVLGVLRAQGHKSSRPASLRQLRSVASQLHALRANANEWRTVLALSGRTAFADRSVALANYNRAVGLRGLVRGLQAETPTLERRVLNDSRLSIYPGGRDDVANHRINVRVLVLVLYMAEAHGSVTVSSLDSGHRLYSRPGVISAHKYGLAVDIAALGGESILGHQQVGGITERAVRNILLLPVELRPKQVISLLGLGGPSFPLADHYDHIHVGY
jgi:hypothetical protein